MRTQLKNKQRAIRRRTTAHRTQKVAVFLISFFFLIGLVTVDEAYSEMMGQDSTLCLQTRRLNEEVVRFSLLGQEATVNVSLVQEGWEQIERMEQEIRSLLSPKGKKRAEERDDLPFEGKIL